MTKTYMDVEDLEVYRKLCKLHIDVCDLTHQWPAEEKYELGSQVRRSSNSAAAQLAEKHSDRHIRNKNLNDIGQRMTSPTRTPNPEPRTPNPRTSE